MEIVIHGTKGGCKIFTPQKTSGLLDVTADSPKADAIGQQAYAIRFTEANTILSKYRIVRDVRGDKRTGFVGFSLFLMPNEKLPGIDIIDLLDKVSDEYCLKYIVENNLNEVVENWNFLDVILSDYKGKLKLNEEKIKSGQIDDAFIYFKDKEELKQYFEVLYQEEYCDYRQVLFVSKEFETLLKNPLNALRHNPNANLTGKIDLTRTEYKLRKFHGQGENGVNIEIKANEKIRRNKEKITNKDWIEIRYYKSKYYIEIKEEGRLTDDNIKRYLSVDEETKKIDVDKNITLEPIRKTVSFNVVDNNGNPIHSAKVICRNSDSRTEKNTNPIIFEGDEIGQKWGLCIDAGEKYTGYKEEIIPEQKYTAKITLNKQKIIEIQVIDKENRKNISNFQVWVNDGRGHRSNPPELIFIGKDIEKDWHVEISAPGYKTEKDSFYPGSQNEPIVFRLKKISYSTTHNSNNIHKYSISAGKHGKISNNWPSYSNDIHGNDLSKDVILSNKGYVLTGFKLDSTKQEADFDGVLVAQYRKKKLSLKLLICSFSILLIVGVLVWVLNPFSTSNNETTIEQERIEQYIKGDSLLLSMLNTYRDAWENQKPEVETKKSYNPLTWFGKDESAELNEWHSIMQKIEEAISKRELVDNANFAELVNQQYSTRQKNFKTAIEEIEVDKYDEIKERLGNISILTLCQIADSIKVILVPSATTIEDKGQQEVESNSTSSDVTQKENKQPPAVTPDEKAEEKSRAQQTSTPDIRAEIIAYLNGSELKRKELDDYKNQKINGNLKTSIGLALKLWTINGSNNNSYSSYQKELAKDNNLSNSDLKRLVDSMCGKERPKYVIELPASDQNKSLSHIKGKLQ